MGAAPGVNKFGTAISGTFTITRKLGRKYYANNTLATGAVTQGEFDVTGDIVVEGNAASLAEYADWDNAVPRLMRLAFTNSVGGTALGATGLYKSVLFDIPCYYTAWDLSGADAGTKVAKASWQYSYDIVNSYSLAVTAINARTTAY
jgi:hypothetical protein